MIKKGTELVPVENWKGTYTDGDSYSCEWDDLYTNPLFY